MTQALLLHCRQHAQRSTASERDIRSTSPSVLSERAVTPLPSFLYTTRWAATQNVLANLVDQSRVRCKHKGTGYTDSPDGWITCHFEGQPDIRARFVIGADGVRSIIRRSMFPSDPGPRYLGFMNWNSVRHVLGSSFAPGCEIIRAIYDKPGDFNTMVFLINAGDDYQFWQVRVACAEPRFTDGVGPAGGIPGSKARVIEHLHQYGWQDVLQEVEATDESAIYERAMLDSLPLPKWTGAGGRVVLLGDAAHAMYTGPGQGARMAFEDAHQMMLALEQQWPNVAAVAQQYEEARIHRATTVQNCAACMCHLKGLAQQMDGFWSTLDDGSNDGKMARLREFGNWLNSYPSSMHGLPGSRYTSPEVLKAFNKHCAAATAKHMKASKAA
eukprot:GHRR01017007.1.p1 GENE.GHRR01017007.1~~GHRR01017007.1.p1  ORF type:complete len:385 (+),score=114.10 GHRR01017007.1:670-1824(+)